MHDRCSIGAIHYASYAPWLAAQCSPIKQPRFYRVSEWRRGCRCPPGMQFSDFYGSVQNLCTICKLSRHEAIHATPLGKSPTQQRPPGRRGQFLGRAVILGGCLVITPSFTPLLTTLTLRSRGVGRRAVILTTRFDCTFFRGPPACRHSDDAF